MIPSPFEELAVTKLTTGRLSVCWLAVVAVTPAFGQDDGTAAARANIERYRTPPEFVAPGDPFDARACMRDKSIFTIPASSAIPFIKTITDRKDVLAEEIGFEHAEWENQGNPTQWIQGIDYAVNNKFDLVSLLAGADPRFFEPQVKAARDAGVDVVASHLTGLEQAVPGGVTAATSIDYKTAGSLLADWSIAQTDGKVNALVLVSNEALSTDSIVSGLTESFAANCPDCQYEVVNVPIADWATKIQPTVAGKLQSNPALNYVIPIYDSMSSFVVPAITISGKGDRVKVATFNGTPFVLDYVRGGQVEIDIGENLDWVAHAMLDAEMRLLCGQEPISDSKVPLLVFDESNVETAGVPAEASKGYGDAYVEGYRALWMLE